MEEKFNIGDIVKLKLLGDAHYYMITDSIDLTQKGEEEIDVDYDMVIIYPIIENPIIETMIHDELEVVAEFESRDYQLLLDYIMRERQILGYSVLPQDVGRIVVGRATKRQEPIDYAKDINQVKKPIKKDKKVEFGLKEIDAIMKDEVGQNNINLQRERMDIHLDLLHKAMGNDDKKQIDFHKEKLAEIRLILMELEYFNLGKRRRR